MTDGKKKAGKKEVETKSFNSRGESYTPSDLELLTGVLSSLGISYIIRQDYTLVLATKYIKFTGDGKRELQ